MRVLVLLLVIGGCADKAVAPYPVSEPPRQIDAAVAEADVFDVRVHGEATLSQAYTVDADGTVNVPLIGRVMVRGLTPSQIEEELEKRLRDGYIKDPSVSVKVLEYKSKRVHVIGMVKQPGTFPFTENMSIVEAIAKAGGFLGSAKKNSVRVTREDDGKPRRIYVAVEDIGQGKAPNFLLRPGDVIFVPERPF
jgi:protein involved in polysaccharide export with SLBB domain